MGEPGRFITPLLFTASDPDDTHILCMFEHGIIEDPTSETVLEHARAAVRAWLVTDDGRDAIAAFQRGRQHPAAFDWNEAIHEMPTSAWERFGLKVVSREAIEPSDIAGLHESVIKDEHNAR